MNNTSAYSTSSILIKILAWLTVVASGYVLFNVILDFLGYIPKSDYLREINMTLQNGVPFFLFLTGTFIKNKKLRIPLLISFPIFFVAYLTMTLDFWQFIDIPGNIIKWTVGPSLAVLLLTYFVHFFTKRKKTILDFLKLIWFFCLSYAFISVRFPIGWHELFFFQLSVYLFPLLMAFGFANYFRKTDL